MTEIVLALAVWAIALFAMWALLTDPSSFDPNDHPPKDEEKK